MHAREGAPGARTILRARHLEGVESLDGLPPDLLEALLGCARRRKVLSDESLPRLIGAGLSTLDLSGQNMLSDVALRSLAARGQPLEARHFGYGVLQHVVSWRPPRSVPLAH